MKEYKGHLLYESKDCAALGHKPGNGADGRHCVICEGGLGVCARCVEYEAGLDNPCKPPVLIPYPVVTSHKKCDKCGEELRHHLWEELTGMIYCKPKEVMNGEVKL